MSKTGGIFSREIHFIQEKEIKPSLTYIHQIKVSDDFERTILFISILFYMKFTLVGQK